jgi:hypothetical protein
MCSKLLHFLDTLHTEFGVVQPTPAAADRLVLVREFYAEASAAVASQAVCPQQEELKG